MLENIIKNFLIEGEVLDVKPYGKGHINETFIVKTSSKKYILQHLNTNIFKNYEGLMNNIFLVTNFIKDKLYKENGIIPKNILTFCQCRDGKIYYVENNTCYRMMNLVEDSIVFQQTDDENILQEAGKCLGDFIFKLSDFDASKLCEVIPMFHNTKKRFEDFKDAISKDVLKRVQLVKEDVDFILERENVVSLIVDAIENKTIPLRVTHNDTKLNNILFDKKTHKAICLIDLDTIMPGSLLYDFGDAVRIACSTAGEEERDLEKVKFSYKSYEAMLKGFLKSTKDVITKKEVSMLHIGAKIMTFEIGLRFLEDYIRGDVYFKIHNDDDNLVRARTQIKMVKEIEQYENKMEELAHKYYNELKKMME